MFSLILTRGLLCDERCWFSFDLEWDPW